jgi:glutaredoxin
VHIPGCRRFLAGTEVPVADVSGGVAGSPIVQTRTVQHEVTLLVRAGCHACAAAREDIARICAELGVPWQTSDVDADAQLRAEYGDRVPVILVDGLEHGFWAVQEQRLRTALTR